MVALAGRMEMETEGSEERWNPRRESVPGPQKSSAVAGTTTPQWAQEGIQISYSPLNFVTLPKTEKKFKKRHRHMNKALCSFKTLFPLIYTQRPIFLKILAMKHIAAAAAAKSLQCVRLCAIPQTAAHQAPPSLGFSRQEHWSGLPFPSPVHESEK